MDCAGRAPPCGALARASFLLFPSAVWEREITADHQERGFMASKSKQARGPMTNNSAVSRPAAKDTGTTSLTRRWQVLILGALAVTAFGVTYGLVKWSQ